MRKLFIIGILLAVMVLGLSGCVEQSDIPLTTRLDRVESNMEQWDSRMEQLASSTEALSQQISSLQQQLQQSQVQTTSTYTSPPSPTVVYVPTPPTIIYVPVPVYVPSCPNIPPRPRDYPPPKRYYFPWQNNIPYNREIFAEQPRIAPATDWTQPRYTPLEPAIIGGVTRDGRVPIEINTGHLGESSVEWQHDRAM
jgi:outer membrane murein-binding lipoprotein Lpp